MGKTDVLRRLAPGLATMADNIDATLADILGRLEKIEQAEAKHRAQPARILPERARTPDELLGEMRGLSPTERAMMLNKLKS
jgi:hypothetical protein